jgi:transposase
MGDLTALDVHKQYTHALVERGDEILREQRVYHEKGAIKAFLAGVEPGSPVAVEATGNWYWVVDEIEEAGCVPRLVHPRKAKLLMGLTNKSDKLDTRGMNTLQRNKTLPVVWIPPGELRDKRDLPRARMVMKNQSTRLRNRLHATLAKYMIAAPDASDIFAPGARQALLGCIGQLPEHSRFSVERELEMIDELSEQVELFETRIEEVFERSREVAILDTLPGVGFTLAVVQSVEIGDVGRFARAEKLVGYCGTAPVVKSSGGKMRFGRLRPDVNRYLKWAFIEAANVVCMNQARWAQRHVVQLYRRIRSRRDHPKAIGAVARHLTEAAYWMLKKGEAYKEPHWQPSSSTKA